MLILAHRLAVGLGFSLEWLAVCQSLILLGRYMILASLVEWKNRRGPRLGIEVRGCECLRVVRKISRKVEGTKRELESHQ